MDKTITVFVALPVFNRRESTLAFLQMLKAQDYGYIECVICDDASEDGTIEAVRSKFPETHIISGKGDLWWTGGMNCCIQYILEHATDDDYVLTINDDVVLPRHYISQKVQRSKEYPHAIIGSVCVDQQHPDCIETTGLFMHNRSCTLHNLLPAGSSLEAARKIHSDMLPATHLPGKGVLVPVALYQKLGLYDAQHLPHYHADSEFTYRAYRSGTDVFVDLNSIVYSDVNRENVGRASVMPSLSAIVKSITDPHGLNSWRSYRHLAYRYHYNQRFRFLFVTYARIIGGIVKRRWRQC